MRLEAWAPQIATFSATHRVIAVDMPGHGDSERLPFGSRLEEFVGWFGRFLDELDLAEVNVAGHSMGALISGGAAATMGKRIRRVAYLNGVYRRAPEAKVAVMARAASILSHGIDLGEPLQRWFSDDPNAAHARTLTARWLQLIDIQSYTIAYAAFAGGDETYADCWPKVLCPALFLTGSSDPNSTPEMARQMAAITPNGWARVVQGHRHMVNLTAPDIVSAFMAEWLQHDVAPE
jgi:pimeloyl-ACP methyl ester carboxylesterase